MMLLWGISGVALVASALSWMRARRTSRQLAQLSDLFWQLQYQQGELRAQLQRERGQVDESGPAPAVPDGFIPLASLKR